MADGMVSSSSAASVIQMRWSCHESSDFPLSRFQPGGVGAEVEAAGAAAAMAVEGIGIKAAAGIEVEIECGTGTLVTKMSLKDVVEREKGGEMKSPERGQDGEGQKEGRRRKREKKERSTGKRRRLQHHRHHNRSLLPKMETTARKNRPVLLRVRLRMVQMRRVTAAVRPPKKAAAAQLRNTAALQGMRKRGSEGIAEEEGLSEMAGTGNVKRTKGAATTEALQTMQ